MRPGLQLCTFMLDGQLCGFDVLTVQEVIQVAAMTHVPLAPHAVRGLMNLRGQIVAAIDLRRRLGLPDRPAGKEPCHVVVRLAGGAVSVLVDAIGDVVDVDQAQFEPPPDTLRLDRDVVRGAYKLRDRLLLALDPEAMATFAPKHDDGDIRAPRGGTR